MRGRRKDFKPEKRLFVVATEGEKTEPIYFQEFQPGRDDGFRLKILPSKKGKSHPIDVVERLIAYAREHKPGKNTEYWAVVDRDIWLQADLDKAAAMLAGRPDHYLALSNPCFEFWLWLHLKTNRPFADRHDCQRQLERIYPGGFAKGDYDASAVMPLVTTACKRASELDQTLEAAWPKGQETWVYRLMENLR